MNRSFVIECVGKHTDGHFDRDSNVAADGVGFNGKRQIMEISIDTDLSPQALENIAEGMRIKHLPADVEVLTHDAATYLAWLERTAERVRKGMRDPS